MENQNLSEIELKFIELERQKAEHKKFFDDLREATSELVRVHGFDHYFQDDEGIVYKTAECKGKFVYFETVEVNRTRRSGEAKGSLSMTEAEKAGFDLITPAKLLNGEKSV